MLRALIAALFVAAAATAVAHADLGRAGTKGTVTAYELDGRTVIGNARAEQLAPVEAHVAASRIAGWTPDGRLVFARGEPAQVVRAVPSAVIRRAGRP